MREGKSPLASCRRLASEFKGLFPWFPVLVMHSLSSRWTKCKELFGTTKAIVYTLLFGFQLHPIDLKVNLNICPPCVSSCLIKYTTIGLYVYTSTCMYIKTSPFFQFQWPEIESHRPFILFLLVSAWTRLYSTSIRRRTHCKTGHLFFFFLCKSLNFC